MLEINTSREIQKTFAIIKPDAVRAGNAQAIKDRIVMEGFTIVAAEECLLTKEHAGGFYAEHQGKPFYEGLIEYMTSGPVVLMVLAKVDAIKAWRSLMGPTDVSVAREQFPDSIRALYGTSKTYNAVHGSDSVKSAQREIKYFFPRISVDPVPSSEETREYAQEHLNAILVKGLTELCKKKPAEPVKWLAEWLLEHNKSKKGAPELSPTA